MRRRTRDLFSRADVRSDDGVVAVITAVLVLTLLVFVALALDTGRWYLEAARVQTAADSAAMAGVTKMPNDFTGAAADARAMAEDNGFPDAGSSSVTVFKTGRKSELGVTVSSTVRNIFGGIFGNNTSTITRTAVGDYQGPAIMGSPCNTFGNEPNSFLAPTGTTIPNDTPVASGGQGGYSTCQSRQPNFWGAIAGPTTRKDNGDRYSTTTCPSSGTDGCNGSTNSEYDPDGYFFVARVGPELVGQDITMQIYDPAYIDTGFGCQDIPSDATDALNPFTSSADSDSRYDNSANTYCTGDGAPGNSGSETGLITSFALRAPDESLDPLKADVMLDTAGQPCVRQFTSQSSAPTRRQLTAGDSEYRPHLAQVFHQWVGLCTFRVTTAGDYYLQVRTSADTVGATALPGGGSNTMIYRNGPNATSLTATLTSGGGNNMFGLRAFVGDSASQPNALSRYVSVAGWERMPMFQNVASGSTFNLLQVKPDAAGKSFYFDLFDVGDGSTGTVTVLRPLDSNIANDQAIQGCTFLSTLTDTTPSNANLNGLCRFSTSGQNGRVLQLTVPIPAGYDCNANSPGGCWFRVQVNWSGSPTDFTTWNATIGGDAVRLVE